jgi:hypothetical protein
MALAYRKESISKEQSSTANRVVVARLMEALSDICKEQVALIRQSFVRQSHI